MGSWVSLAACTQALIGMGWGWECPEEGWGPAGESPERGRWCGSRGLLQEGEGDIKNVSGVRVGWGVCGVFRGALAAK